MGILTRRHGDLFVISSDRLPEGSPTAHAPRRLSDNFQVWTGQCWSPTKDEAITFASLDAADEYVRANFRRVTQ